MKKLLIILILVAIGVAVATTIATTVTSNYLDAHPGASPLGGAALTHGFSIAFYVLAAIAVAGVTSIEKSATSSRTRSFAASSGCQTRSLSGRA